MSQNDLHSVIQRLYESGCRFVVDMPWIGGIKTIAISREQAAAIAINKNAALAEIIGLTINEYLDWKESDGCVRCNAKTKQGKQCKNSINRGFHLEPQEWKSLKDEGGYCVIHGG